MKQTKIEPIPESLHWYTKEGKPCYEVPLKTPAKDGRTHTPPTVMQARKLGLLPSVTSIKKVLATPHQVINWLVEHAIRSGIKEGDYDKALKDFQEETNRPAEEGEEIHIDVLEGVLAWENTKMYVYNDNPSGHALHNIVEYLKEKGISVDAIETPFACEHGFAGRCDMLGHAGDVVYLLDLKTMNPKTFSGLKAPYVEWGFQLAGYREGLGLDKSSKCVNLVVCRETGALKVFEWTREDIEKQLVRFMLAFNLWKLDKNYDPRSAFYESGPIPANQTNN